MTPDSPFDSGKPRPIATALDGLPARIDAERFDGAVLQELLGSAIGLGR